MNENSNLIVVFYGELTTKGKNIRDFINLLGKNIRSALKNFKNLTYDIRRIISISISMEKTITKSRSHWRRFLESALLLWRSVSTRHWML